jgi:NAD(P) transhydrogenase subunit alpha
VRIVGLNNYPGLVARDASQMYASNVVSLIDHAWDSEAASLRLDPADDVLDSCLLTQAGAVRHAGVRELLESAA